MVRLVIAVSLDGRIAFSSDVKANLGGSADRKVLEESLAWADATLMGRRTLSIHQNTCLIHSKKLINQRRKDGKQDQPISIIVSRKSSFKSNWEFFKQPIQKWLLSPKESSTKTLDYFNHQLRMRETWEENLNILNKKGFSKIALLGGAKLVTSLLLEDKIDELYLTFVPRILTGEYTWTALKVGHLPIELTKSNAWKLEAMQSIGGNEVLLKYLRNRF